MSDKNAKDLRKQLRFVVREIIDEVLTTELCQAAYNQVQKDINERLGKVDEHVKKTLDGIRDNAQNFQGYLMRELTAQSAARTASEQPQTEVTAETPKSE